MAFASVSVDIYLPALPVISKDLGGDAELSITGFLIGFSLAQLFWGPVSDKIGRKKPLIIGVSLFIIGSFFCALSTNIYEMLFWRVFQAFGASTAPMIARAMIRDMFDKTRAARTLSTLVVIMAVAPIIAPFIGSFIAEISSWHFIFYLLSIFGVFVLLALFFVPETLKQRSDESLIRAFKNYKILLFNAHFMRYASALMFYYTAIYTFITASAFVYTQYFGVKTQDYGYFFSVNIIGVMALSFFNRNLVRKFSLDTLLKLAIFVSLISAGLLFLFEISGLLSLYLMAVFIFFVFSSNGIIATSATAAALDRVASNMVGSASALVGAMQYGSGILASILYAFLKDGTPFIMCAMIAFFTFLSAFAIFVRIKFLN